MKWISVEDRLPDDNPQGNKIMVKFEDYISDAEFNTGYRVTDAVFRMGAFFEEMEDYEGDFPDYQELNKVTHWMLVSPPPTNKEEL